MPLDLLPLLDPADAELLTRVRIALVLKQRSSLGTIRIHADRGAVTLRGELPSCFERDVAVATVRHVHGVYRVHDELVVTDVRSRLPQPFVEDSNMVITTSPSPPVPRDGVSPPSPERSVPRTCVPAALGVTLILLLVTTACSRAPKDRVPVHPVEGQVTLGGKPLENALVVLHPRGASDPRTMAARGTTNVEGRFRLRTYEANDGAAAGEYAVTVVHHPLIKEGESYAPGPNVLPRKIATPEATDIVVQVAAGPNTLPPIEVKR